MRRSRRAAFLFLQRKVKTLWTQGGAALDENALIPELTGPPVSAMPMPFTTLPFSKSALALAASMVAASATWAQSPAAEAPAKPEPAPAAKPAATPTERVTVKGTRTEDEQRRQSTAAKIIIGREELDKFGDTSLGEVMKRLPGVTTDGRPGRGGNPRMRGLGAGYTQILIDGERVQGGLSLDSISPDQIERIEIIRAPTAETGARAIGGTINIITREGFTKRLNDLKLGVGVERGEPGGFVGWTRDDQIDSFNYNVSATAWRRQGKESSTTTTTTPERVQVERAQSTDERQGLHASARLQWRLSETDNLMIMPMMVVSKGSGTRQASFSHQPVACDGQAPFNRQLLCSTTGENDSDFALVRLNGQWRTTVDGWRLETRGGVSQSRSTGQSQRLESVDGGSTPDVVQDHTRSTERTQQINLKGSKLLDNDHNLVFGLEAEAAQRDDQREPLLNGQPRLVGFGDNLAASTRRVALFGQDEWSLTPQWAVHGGLRWEGIRTQGEPLGELPAVSNTSSVVTPLLHALWRPEPKSRDQVRISLTRSYKSPTLTQLVAWPSLATRNSETSPDRAGNPALQPELATGIDLAAERYLPGGGLLSVNLFHRRITDLMRSVVSLEDVSWSATPRYVSRPQNVGRATTQGVELEAKGRLTEWVQDAPQVDLRANLSLYVSRVDSVVGPNNRLDSQPGGTLNIGADWKVKDMPLTVGSSVSYTPGYTTRLAENQWLEQPTKRVIDAYALWSFSSAWRLRVSLSNLAPLDTGSTSQVGDEVAQTVSPTAMTWRAQLEIKI
ncbi:TonB-dependent receptor plug domain-containing protein [Ideonella paludis]|nr:TonB-dependent receptor [Ideonella paludis]